MKTTAQRWIQTITWPWTESAHYQVNSPGTAETTSRPSAHVCVMRNSWPFLYMESTNTLIDNFLHLLRKWRPCYDRNNAVTLLSRCPKTVVSSLSALLWTGLTSGRIFPLVNARSLIDPISHQLCNHFRWKCKKCCMAAILPSHTLRSWWEQLWCSGTEGALPFKKTVEGNL